MKPESKSLTAEEQLNETASQTEGMPKSANVDSASVKPCGKYFKKDEQLSQTFNLAEEMTQRSTNVGLASAGKEACRYYYKWRSDELREEHASKLLNTDSHEGWNYTTTRSAQAWVYKHINSSTLFSSSVVSSGCVDSGRDTLCFYFKEKKLDENPDLLVGLLYGSSEL